MKTEPNERGWFGDFGGRMVPETLVAPLQELEDAYDAARNDPQFQTELKMLLREYVGRPTPIFVADRLSAKTGGGTIVLKREDLTHTGAHKINNSIGQMLLARRMGKKRIIAETGAGQHGVATAAAAAQFGLECTVYMGRVDMERQALNVARMQLMGATVVPVEAGAKTLKDAVSEAMRDWVARVRDTYYCLGSALGPHPYPVMVRDFQKIIGEEARAQIIDRCGGLPREVVACVGGGSNAIGLFHAFIGDKDVQLTGVEAGGRSMKLGEHAARFADKKLGILQGTKTYVLQDDHGQIAETHSISAGLDYAAVGPEHAQLESMGRARYTSVTDEEALDAFKTLAHYEGILPALESSHAIAYALKSAKALPKGTTMLVGLSGRGDKDLASVLAAMEKTNGK